MPKFERCDGGYVVTGLWPCASGIPVTNHFPGGGFIPQPEGVTPVMIVVPRADIEIVPDWGGDAAMGMQASGSHSVRVEERFVPDAHIVASPITLLSTEHLPDGTPGTRLHREGVFLGILFGWFSCEFGAILTGAAHAALEEYEQVLRNKPLLFDPRRTRMHDPEFQRILGEAMCRADSGSMRAGRSAAATRCAYGASAARPVGPPASVWRCCFTAPVRPRQSVASVCSVISVTCRCTVSTSSHRRSRRCCGRRFISEQMCHRRFDCGIDR